MCHSGFSFHWCWPSFSLVSIIDSCALQSHLSQLSPLGQSPGSFPVDFQWVAMEAIASKNATGIHTQSITIERYRCLSRGQRIRVRINVSPLPSPPPHSLLFPCSQSCYACTVPCLPVCNDFHPKWNQACQKLAILLMSRFEDLKSDIYIEFTGWDQSSKKVYSSFLFLQYPTHWHTYFIRQVINQHPPNQHMMISHPLMSQ